ncbi:MAG: ATP phosphoribosyltransferase [Myxococcales bacterium]|nr:ATP phosphoribosyltransferase [Myxococcales bacterium]
MPKGRVLNRVESLLGAAGLIPEDSLSTTRKLATPVTNAPAILGAHLEVLLLKNSDVPVYVEHGVADVGVSGTDVLIEAGVSVLRPHTFEFGKCDIVLAGKPEHDLAYLRALPTMLVATKYVRFASDYFSRSGWEAEIVPLSGSVELAPVLGLTHAIVDLMETGKTLRENGLVPHLTIGRTSLKLIANRAMSRAGSASVNRLIDILHTAERDQNHV